MLLNRPGRYSDESISSYLFRLARANYKSVGVLTASLGITRAEWLRNVFTDEQISHIALHLNLSKNDLFLGTYGIYNDLLNGNSHSYLLRNRMKFCPDCFREKPYHRTMWGLKPITFCLQHSSRLIDTCTKCHLPIIFDQFINGFCNRCGYRYHYSESILVPFGSIEFEFQRDFQEALYQSGKMLQTIGGLNANQFLRLAHCSFYLLEGLTSFLDKEAPIIRIFHNRRGGIQINDWLAEAYNHVYWMYQDFPHRFQLVLYEFLKKPRKKLYSQMKAFEALFDVEGFGLIKNKYEQFWINELEKGAVRSDLSIFKQNEDLLLRKKHLRKEEAKQLTGISYPKLEALHQSGQISIITQQNGKTKQHFIDRAIFDRLSHEKQNYITKKEAAQILGIQRESVSQLIKEGLLDEVETAFSHNKLIRLKEVEDLLERSRGVLNTKVEGQKFHQVLIKYSVSGLTVSRLLKFIHEKFLNPQLAVSNGNLMDTWFWEEETERCIGLLKREKQNKEGIYMQGVIKHLKIGERKMKGLMESGLLVPDKTIVWKDGRKRYLFNLRKIEEFKMNMKQSTQSKNSLSRTHIR